MTQEELADRCVRIDGERGVDQSRIAHRESGAIPQMEVSLESTAAGLGISVRHLLMEEIAPARVAAVRFDKTERRVLSLVVRNARKQLGLTQEAFGERVGLPQSRIYSMEGGEHLKGIAEDAIEHLAAALGMSVETFLLQNLEYVPEPELDQAAMRDELRKVLDSGVTAAELVTLAGGAEAGVTPWAVSRSRHGKNVALRTAEAISVALATLRNPTQRSTA